MCSALYSLQGAALKPSRTTAAAIPFARAFVELPKLLTALRARLGCQQERFDYADLSYRENLWHYRGLPYTRVLFCEGVGLHHNPFCKGLPLTAIKGETLLLKNEQLPLPPALYHHKKWLLPYGNGTFRLGATYDENDPSPTPSTQGAAELLDGLRSFIDAEFETREHLAGLRPGTPDARPLLGALPGHTGLYLFNGLGSKGASVAPLMSEHLLQHILLDQPLDPEVDLRRFL